DSNSYVIFGSASGFPANFNLSDLNGTNGFILDTGEEKFGTTVSQAGDINGDGIDDLIVALASTNSETGKSYVIFGSSKGFASRINLSQLNGNNGFTILNNIDGNSISSVSGAGDVNGDRIDDLTLGVSQAFGNGKFAAGKTYVLFGNNGGFTPIFNLSRINGINGLVIHGINESDLSGTSLNSGGDINNDGLSDLIIGSPGNLFNNSPGTSQVVFGSTLFGATNDASNLAKLLFNSGYYLSQNPDVQEAVNKGLFRNAFEHFVTIGFAEGRNPSSYFASDYLINNPDVAAAIANGNVRNGFTHFIKAGVTEGRSSDTLLSALDLLYRQENPDVNQAIQQGFFSSGLEHLVLVGMNEGRQIFPEFQALAETFDSEFYLAENSDVQQAVESRNFPNALSHFVSLGLSEGRDPSSQFSNSEYLANYPDVAAVVSQGILRNGFEHFIKFGFGEERTGSLIL
ncbi:MAG: integrin alpha, partial [Phormidium sp.]